jgi:hypothetical protein
VQEYGWSHVMEPLGYALGTSKISDHLDQAYPLESLPTLSAEKAFEVKYMMQRKPWLVLQPHVQYYAGPGRQLAFQRCSLRRVLLQSYVSNHKKGSYEESAGSVTED